MAHEPLPPPGALERFLGWSGGPFAVWFERYNPPAAAAAAFFTAAAAGVPEAAFGKVLSDVLPSAMSAASTLAGFQATSLSVLLALADSAGTRRLRRMGLYGRLIGFVWDSLATLFAFIGGSLLVLTLHSLGVPVHGRVLPASLAALCVWSVLSFLRLSRLTMKLLRAHDPAAPNPGPARAEG